MPPPRERRTSQPYRDTGVNSVRQHHMPDVIHYSTLPPCSTQFNTIHQYRAIITMDNGCVIVSEQLLLFTIFGMINDDHVWEAVSFSSFAYLAAISLW